MFGIFEIERALATTGVISLASLSGLVFAGVMLIRWIHHP